MVDWITNLVASFGYLGIALLMFLENVFPPIPSELIMPLGGFVAGRGELTFTGVVLAGTAGSVAGQVPLYLLGRLVGRERLTRWVEDHGHWLLLGKDDIDKAAAAFDKHGGKIVFFGRLLPGIRSLVSVPAGIDRMNPVSFLAYSAAGMGIWAAALALAGLLLGDNYDAVADWVGPASKIVFAVLGVAAVVFCVRRWRKLRAGRRA